MMATRALTLLLALLAAACGRGPRGAAPAPSTTAARSGDSAVAALVTRDAIARHTIELASDRYEGRFPGTRGEELAVSYIEPEMRRIGLAPGNPDGSYVQRFELLGRRGGGITATLTARGATTPIDIPGEAAFATTVPEPRTTLRESELVFAGHGITAPEYGWDDYAGVDVRGKTVLVLRGEPELRVAGDSARFDPARFRGPQLTHHGILERKREVARRHGAAGVIFLTQGAPGFRTQAARLHGRESIMLGSEGWPPVVGVVSPALKVRIYAAAGRTFAADSLAAGRPGFRAIPLGVALSLDAASEWRRIPTRNVVGLLPGADPRLRDEHVIFSAHWDAFGIGPAVDGDSIYNGAVDDAAGVGQMLAVAEALASGARARPARTMLFLATSAEEPGLLGARHYAAHPLYPLERTLANVNFDIISLAGETRDVRVYGQGRSTLDEIVADAARLQGRVAEGEREPQQDTWFYQDHFAFVEAGVPAISVAAGNDAVGKPPGYGEQRARQYRTRDYHRPSDEVRPDWEWGSIVQDARLGLLVGLRIADGVAPRPTWKPGAEVGARPVPRRQ